MTMRSTFLFTSTFYCAVSSLAGVEAFRIGPFERPGRFPSAIGAGAAGNELEDNVTVSRRAALVRALGIASASAFIGLVGNPVPSIAAADDNIRPGGKVQYGLEELMTQKGHGTTSSPVQENLRFGVSRKLADRICCYNRHFAEYSGYFDKESNFKEVVLNSKGPVTFYDR